MNLKPGTVLGHYTIIAAVGRGGMSTVYRARQESLQRDVAVKVLPEFFATDAEFRERFAREAATIARLRHPNIVTVFDFGEEVGTPYIVTEFLPGPTLSTWVNAGKPIAEVVDVLRRLANAIDYAHEHGVLHRDIKPSNVMLDAEGQPILTDFGLARIVGSLPPLTRTGLPVGTPEYMAPELAAGDTVTAKVDDYAFAVMAFELLTGGLPFNAESPLAVLLAHMNEPPPLLSARCPGAPPAFDDVFNRALAKDPAERFSTAGAFIEALSARVHVEAAAESHAEAASVPPTEPASLGRGPISRNSMEEGEETRAIRVSWLSAAPTALQHPAAVLLFGLAALAFAYSAILAPEAGGGGVALAGGAVAAVLGVAAAALAFPKEYQARADNLDRERRLDREAREHQELERLAESLKLGFAAAQSTDGAQALERLTAEYHQLEPTLARDAGVSFATLQVPGLATEAYRRGLSVLVDGLELTTTANSPGPDRLKAEMATLERELAELERAGGAQQRLALRRQALESHRERLRMLDDLQIRLDQLFHQARQCEAALHRTRINLAALRLNADSGPSVESAVRALQRTIEQARTVQDEVRRLGY